MQEAAQPQRPKLLIRCRDPERAIAWLGKAFGFETRCLATRPDGGFAYAHLAFADNLIMVTPSRDADSDTRSLLPEVANRLTTQDCCFLVENLMAHFTRAKSAGAEIVQNLKADEHGAYRYACRDPDGHVWNFGARDRCKDTALPQAPRPRRASRQNRLAQGLGLAAASLAVMAFFMPEWGSQTAPAVTTAPAAPLQMTNSAPPKDGAMVDALQRARNELAEERAVRQAVEAAQRKLLAELSQERSARQNVERTAARLETQLSAARTVRSQAEEIARDLDDHLKRNAQAARAAGTSSPANPLLAEGQAAMAKGDVDAARRLFKRLVEDGVPEAAIALGSTYDPVVVEQIAGASAQADRTQAKHWYRRAIELAQAAVERQPGK